MEEKTLSREKRENLERSVWFNVNSLNSLHIEGAFRLLWSLEQKMLFEIREKMVSDDGTGSDNLDLKQW